MTKIEEVLTNILKYLYTLTTMFDAEKFLKSLPKRARLLNLWVKVVHAVCHAGYNDYETACDKIDEYAFKYNELAKDDIPDDGVEADHFFDVHDVLEYCDVDIDGIDPNDDPSISSRSFFLSFEQLCLTYKLSIEKHIKIFPKFLQHKLLITAYQKESILPDFGADIHGVCLTWKHAAKAYILGMVDGKINPDFENMSKYECHNYELQDPEIPLTLPIKKWDTVSHEAIQCRHLMLLVAYKITSPTQDHVILFPDQAEYIKSVARPLIMAKAMALDEISDLMCADVAIKIGSFMKY